MKATKKPITISYCIWTGENAKEMQDFLNRNGYSHVATDDLIIETLEGDLRASIGDYIIKGVQGEYYPCKPDMFLATHDLVEEK